MDDESEMEAAFRTQDEQLARIIASLPSLDDGEDFHPTVHIESRRRRGASSTVKRTFVLLHQGERHKGSVPRGSALTALVDEGRQKTLEFKKNISNSQLLPIIKNQFDDVSLR